MEKISTAQAAEELETTRYQLECQMRNKDIDIGYYVKHKGMRRGRYYIFRPLLDAEKQRRGISV